jgi:hypothetical protein
VARDGRRPAAVSVISVLAATVRMGPACHHRLFERGNDRKGHAIGLPLGRQLAQVDLGSLDLLTYRPWVFRLRLPGPDDDVPEAPTPTGADEA